MSTNNFGLTLDTLAPSGSISLATSDLKATNAAISYTINKGDATYMCCWFSSGSAATALPDSPTWEAAATSKTATPSSNGTWYYNLCLMDDVNNKSTVYSAGPVAYDTVKPTVSDVSLNNGASTTTSRTVTLTFKFADTAPSSTVTYYSVSGDCTALTNIAITDAERTAGSITATITLSGTGEEEAATKTVSVTVKDAAGNVSDSGSDSIVLDTKPIAPTTTVYKGNSTSGLKLSNNTGFIAWTNSSQILVNMVVTDSDWTSYKIYGDVNTTEKATSGTTQAAPAASGNVTSAEQTAKTKNVSVYLIASDSDSRKVYVDYTDDAGNTTTHTLTLKVDYSAPTVSQTADKTFVSAVSGYNSVVVTPTVSTTIAGVKSYQWYLNGEALSSTVTNASGNDTPVAITVPSSVYTDGSSSVDYVEEKFTLKVIDNALNETTSTATIVKYDTKAPTGTLTMNTWYNGDTADQTTYTKWSSVSVSTSGITDGSGAGMATMQAWISQTAADTSAAGSAITFASSIGYSNINGASTATDADGYYLHVKFVDAVGNSNIIHSNAFGIDKTAPTSGKAAFVYDSGLSAYKTTSASLSWSADFSVSGLGSIAVYGPATNGIVDADGNAITTPTYVTKSAASGTESVTLATGNGTRTAYIIFKDKAGNYTSYTSAECELDMTAPNAQFWIYDADDSAYKTSPSSNYKFYVRFTGNEDGGTTASATNLWYKVWGDFNTDSSHSATATAEPTTWTEVSAWDINQPTSAAGTKDAKVLGPFYATTPDGTKSIHLSVRDNAGNVYTPTALSWILDTTAPTVDVTTVDHNRISCVHEYRLSDPDKATTHYADETNYKFTPDSNIIAWKTEVVTGTAAAPVYTAIGTTHGSSNMTGTTSAASTAVACMIRGDDYRDALRTALGKSSTESVDGTYYVVVSVEDEAGTWSEYGTILVS